MSPRREMRNDNKLHKISDEAIILNLLMSAKDCGSEIFIWRLVGGSKILGQVRIESVRKFRKDFCIIPEEGQDRQVQELMGSQNHIDIYVPGAALLLRCTIKQTDAPYRYYLEIPKFVAQAERRKSIRVNVNDGADVQISFGKIIAGPKSMSQHFLKPCFDVSTGGVSFYVSKTEAKFFDLSDNIESIEIKAGQWSSKVGAEVISIREVEPDEYNGLTYKAFRISCRFSKIDQISRKYLEKYIFEKIKDELHAINE